MRLPVSWRVRLSRLHLRQPYERRLVLERDDVEHAEPLAGAEVDLLPRLDHHRVGRFAEIVPVRRVESVPEHVSSVPGPDGEPTLSASTRDHLADG